MHTTASPLSAQRGGRGAGTGTGQAGRGGAWGSVMATEPLRWLVQRPVVVVVAWVHEAGDAVVAYKWDNH